MNPSRRAARGGLYCALTVICLWMGSIIPSLKLSFLAICSAIICFSIITIGIKGSLAVYTASALLSWMLGLIPFSAAYICIFGIYGFIKYYIEGINKTFLEIFMKLVFFLFSASILYYIFKLLNITLTMDSGIYIYAAGFIIAAALYDYALTILINYFIRRFKR